MTLTTEAPDPTNTSPIDLTATFSRPVTFRAGRAVTNGTVTGFAGSGAVYVPAADGPVTVKIPSGRPRTRPATGISRPLSCLGFTMPRGSW